MNAVSGSSILLVLLLTMVLGISLMNSMRNAVYMLDIARKREQYEQHYYETEGLLNLGIVCVIKQNMNQNNDLREIIIEQWPPCSRNNCQGKLKITKTNPTNYAIESFLIKNDAAVCILSCILSKQKRSMQIDGREKEWFVISNFQHTFSAV